jgi:hypothetical protein
MRSGIAGEVKEQSDLQVAAEAADGNEALLTYRAHRPQRHAYGSSDAQCQRFRPFLQCVSPAIPSSAFG